jgi:hypothetical protein
MKPKNKFQQRVFELSKNYLPLPKHRQNGVIRTASTISDEELKTALYPVWSAVIHGRTRQPKRIVPARTARQS